MDEKQKKKRKEKKRKYEQDRLGTDVRKTKQSARGVGFHTCSSASRHSVRTCGEKPTTNSLENARKAWARGWSNSI
jgi:hypothetical protein